MEVVWYWRTQCMPYLRATFGRRTEAGASLVEYALLVSLIAVVCVVAVTFLGKASSRTFGSVGSSISNP